MFETGCPEAVTFELSGEPGIIPLRLYPEMTSGYVDQQVTLPLRLENRAGFRGNVRLRAEMRWEYRNLYFSALQTSLPNGRIEVELDSIIDDDRVIQFTYEGPLTSLENDLLAKLDILVLLGINDSTEITVNVLELLPLAPENRLELIDEDGLFVTLGICEVDGHRFVRIDQPLQATKLYPNPADNHVKIDLQSTVSGVGELHIFKVDGNSVVAGSR